MSCESLLPHSLDCVQGRKIQVCGLNPKGTRSCGIGVTKRLRVSLQLVVTSAVRGVDVPAPRSPSRPRPPLPPKPCSLFPGRGDLGFASLTIKSSTSQFSALSRWSYKRLCLITWCSSSPSCNEVNQRLACSMIFHENI